MPQHQLRGLRLAGPRLAADQHHLVIFVPGAASDGLGDHSEHVRVQLSLAGQRVQAVGFMVLL